MTGKALMVSVVYVLTLLAGSAAAQAPSGLEYTDVPDMPSGIEGERVQVLFDAAQGDSNCRRKSPSASLQNSGFAARLP